MPPTYLLLIRASPQMKFTLSSIFFIICLVSFGQSDFGSWNGVGLSFKKSKDLSFGLDAEMRFDHNLHRLERYYFSPGVKYDLSKLIRIGSSYRFSVFPDENELSHRATIDLEFRDLAQTFLNTNRFDMNFRLRSTLSSFKYSISEPVIRGKLLLTYNLPKTKLKPEVAAEIFYGFNDQLVYTNDRVYGIHRFTKYRLRAGLDHEIGNHGINIFYQLQSPLTESSIDHTIGIRYKYQIDLK